MQADVCNCLFTIPLIGVRLPDILVPYLQYSEVCKLVPVSKGMCVGSTSVALQRTCTGTRSKRAKLVLLRSRGQERLTRVIWQHWEKFDLSLEQRCCRGQCRPEQVQPLLAYLWAPLSTKLPWSKSAKSSVKKCVYNLRRSRTQ